MNILSTCKGNNKLSSFSVGYCHSVLLEVLKERERQVGKWDGVFDDADWLPGDWYSMIEDYNGWARRMACMGSKDKARNRYIQIAALAVAAVEALDKKEQTDAHTST